MNMAGMSATGRDQQVVTAYAHLMVARYFLHHADVLQVSNQCVACVQHEIPFCL